MKTFKFGFMHFKKYIWQAIFYIAVLLLSAVMSLALVQISRYVLDFVLRPTDGATGFIEEFLASGGLGEVGGFHLLINLCVLFASIVVLRAVLQYFGGIVAQNYGNKLAKDLRAVTLSKMFQRNYFYSTGDIYTMLTYDVFYTKELFQTLFPQLISFLFYVVISLVLIFFLHWALGLFMLIGLPVIIWLSIRYVKTTKPYFVSARRYARKLSTVTTEAMSGIFDIKTNGYERGAITTLSNKNDQYTNVKNEQTNKSNKYQMWFLLLRAVFYGGMIIVAGYLAIVGEITIGGFSVAVSYAVMMLDNVVNSAVKMYQIQEALTYAENLRKYVHKRNHIANNKTKQKVEGDVSLEATKLSVLGTDGHSLDKISFKIEQGEKVGFWVKDDQGGHALSSVLLRRIEYEHGGISINGTDYKEINVDSIRQQYSYVAPSTFLFNKSIKENIVMYQKFDEEKYKKVLKLVGIEKFLKKMPNGDQEIVEVKNEGYPAQQRQMIGLARAVYQESKVLIMERPMQAQSIEKITAIVEKINKSEKDRSVIVISPDLEIMKSCQRIYVLEDGNIVDEASFEEILKNHIQKEIDEKN